MWPSTHRPILQESRRWDPLFIEDDHEFQASSVEGVFDWDLNPMEEVEFRHDHMHYSVLDGPVPTVRTYKYLGITINVRLGDSRKVIIGERSMEYDFAISQAKKGMKVLYALRPFLTDRLCPIILKIGLVRNLLCSRMMYGSELIGFQGHHADPMQRVLNVAAKWILGLSKDSHNVDAFTLCYELSLPPVHQEMCAMRARLATKLNAHTDGGLNTWIQTLWDHPPTNREIKLHKTWVSTSQAWLKKADKDARKYSKLLDEDVDCPARTFGWDNQDLAPLRPWAQLGRMFEMSCRSNQYNSTMLQAMRMVFFRDREEGGPPEVDTRLLQQWIENGNDEEDFIIRPIAGRFDAPWDYVSERRSMDEGRNIPAGRTRGEVTRTNLVRDVVLERMMSSNHSKSWTAYDIMNFGTTRGYLREAANRPNLTEGVRWLSLARCRGFPTVEGAWQSIKRSGRNPPFECGKCPLCKQEMVDKWEWAHLLLECLYTPVCTSWERYLRQNITYIRNNLEARGWHELRNLRQDLKGLEGENWHLTLTARVVSIFLCGGSYRPLE